MSSPLIKSIADWFRRIDERGDAWAAKRLTAEEYADAKAFDAVLKRNFWRWLAIYLVIMLRRRPEKLEVSRSFAHLFKSS